MTNRTILAQPLTREAFAPFGDVIETPGAEQITINRGKCIRHHALASAEVAGPGARVVINIFCAEPYSLPHSLDLVERHPLGSQAFFPLGATPWLVIVCPEQDGAPGPPIAFLAGADQGINLRRNVWHGVLTPLQSAADFLVVDRAGEGINLEEVTFADPWEIVVPEALYDRLR